ncbi:MAG: S-layer homology domain-containing protein, partial [Clostridia bacterium]|nr:S-layer homology domain-containing protein [Clostridia bacterium]
TVENEGKLTAMGATAVNIINETGSSYSVKSEETDETTGLTTMVLVKKTDASANSVASVTTAGDVTTDYTDFAEAIAAAKASEGSTLKLLEDISTSKPVYINSGAFTIDLNGKTWTLVKEGLHIYSTADIILTDSSSNGNGKLLGSENYSTLYLYDSAKLDIQRGTMESNSNLTVDMAVFGNSTAELTVSGGKLLANGFNSTAICTRGALVKVTGGTIVSDNNIACYKGVIDLSGHSNPTGITIYNAVSDGLAVSDDTIRLPEGYALLDGAGHAVTTLVRSETYTVGKAPTFYSVEVSAVDAADRFELKGAFVQLLEGQSNVIAEWESGWVPHTIEGLKADVTYTLRAIVAPNGYILPTDTTFSINTDGTLDNSSVTTTDENGILLIEFVKTAVKVSAVDQANGKDLAGAAMQICDPEGSIVAEWTSTDMPKEIIGLYTGVPYTILPAAAPEGYTIPDAVTFSINEMGDVITSGDTDEDDALLIKFAQTVVRVKAVDAEGAAVEGATVQILNAQGSAVAEWNSAADMESTEDTDESVWEVLGLKAGEEYTLRVAVTPNGYETPGSMPFFLEKYGDVVYADVAVTDNVLMVEFAKAVPKTYTVILVTNGGIIRDGDVTEYTYGVGAKLPTNVTRSGFYFGGWYDNEGCRGTAVTEITAADIGNKTFYAKWNFIYFPIVPSNPTYPPVVNGGDNGDVVVTPKNPEKGDTVTIIPDPDAGYEVDEVIVTDKNGNPMTVVDNGDGTYSFKQPRGKVKIEVTFKEITKVCPRDWTCPMYGYTDLGRSLWYHDGIHYCIEHGLMQGVGNNQFDPDSTTTRAMIVTILWRLEGSPIVNYAMDFEDVAADQWHTEAIRWAASEKIVEGYGNGKFGTNDAITREQMVTIMFRYAKHKGYDVSVGENTNILSYDDAFDVAEWAIPAMQWACGSGMIQGIADGNMMNLAPQGNATRAQAAAILQRFCENATNKD